MYHPSGVFHSGAYYLGRNPLEATLTGTTHRAAVIYRAETLNLLQSERLPMYLLTAARLFSCSLNLAVILYQPAGKIYNEEPCR